MRGRKLARQRLRLPDILKSQTSQSLTMPEFPTSTCMATPNSFRLSKGRKGFTVLMVKLVSMTKPRLLILGLCTRALAHMARQTSVTLKAFMVQGLHMLQRPMMTLSQCILALVSLPRHSMVILQKAIGPLGSMRRATILGFRLDMRPSADIPRKNTRWPTTPLEIFRSACLPMRSL